MWTNKDVTKIGRLKNKDTLKGLIPGLGTQRSKTIDYNDRIKKQREDTKNVKDNSKKDLLIKSIIYYEKNFKTTLIKISPEKTLGENLDVLTEAQLFEVNYILDFCHDPKDFEHPEIPRLIVTIPEHDIMKLIIVKLKKKIPAFKLRLELMELETRESEIEKKKKQLRVNITNAQEAYKTRAIKSDKENIEEKNKSSIICTYPECGKVCNSPAGLASHLRSHNAPKSNGVKPVIPKSMKNGKVKSIPGSKGTIKV